MIYDVDLRRVAARFGKSRGTRFLAISMRCAPFFFLPGVTHPPQIHPSSSSSISLHSSAHSSWAGKAIDLPAVVVGILGAASAYSFELGKHKKGQQVRA